jgi:hypothetical protein
MSIHRAGEHGNVKLGLKWVIIYVKISDTRHELLRSSYQGGWKALWGLFDKKALEPYP